MFFFRGMRFWTVVFMRLRDFVCFRLGTANQIEIPPRKSGKGACRTPTDDAAAIEDGTDKPGATFIPANSRDMGGVRPDGRDGRN